jgi:nitrogen fixation protein NifZ
MGTKISRESDIVELVNPPKFDYGQKVVSKKYVRNDGTFPGREVGDILVSKGDVGYVTSIGTFLQQFYIYGVDFYQLGYRVGMRGKELELLDEEEDDTLETEVTIESEKTHG